jgi:hypothetical protein
VFEVEVYLHHHFLQVNLHHQALCYYLIHLYHHLHHLYQTLVLMFLLDYLEEDLLEVCYQLPLIQIPSLHHLNLQGLLGIQGNYHSYQLRVHLL